jgi:hypothetical protein
MALFDIQAGFWGIRYQMEALVGQHLSDQALQQTGGNGGAYFAASFIGEVPETEREQALRDNDRTRNCAASIDQIPNRPQLAHPAARTS